MRKTNHSNKIQRRILIITLSCILGMCMIISCVSYFIFQNFLQHSLIQSTETNLQLLTDTINESISDVYQMVRFCQTNASVASYLDHAPDQDPVLSVSTYDRIFEEHGNNPSSSYMPRLAIISNDRFLQVVDTSYSSTADLAKEIPELPYFETLVNDSAYNFSTGFIKDPFYRKGRMILPIIRPITYQYNSIQGGYLFLEVSCNLFTDPLKHYNIAEDSSLYLTIGGHQYIYENGTIQEYDHGYEILQDMNSSAVTDDISICKVKWDDGSNSILVTSPLNMKDCYISQSISHSELFNQLALFFLILAVTLVAILGIGIALMMILNRMINVPVQKIRDKMVKISGGDFSRDLSIEWDHELGDIGKGINDLSENVLLLMDKKIEDEKLKRDLEYKMLQSQINPHFLYNTLNSIKWMASIQGAEGISEMTTALSRLVRSISKGTSLLVSIREELALVTDYFTIQKYRYGGTITLNILVDDELLYDSQIVKFTLQPLVENAIFHGIEPKGCAGDITIHIKHENKVQTTDICIDITDNGIGMSKEKAAQVLLNSEDTGRDFFKEIGVSNVHKRLQYEFGESYGITIDSVEGKYTTMSIHIPDRKESLGGENV